VSDYKCSVCKKILSGWETYVYRGMFSCEEHFDEMVDKRDYQRSEIIKEESAKTEPLRGLDFGDNVVGRANRELLKGELEVCSKESGRLREYEGRLDE
jgi:hypothetical protein